jgi:hypothetical protein
MNQASQTGFTTRTPPDAVIDLQTLRFPWGRPLPGWARGEPLLKSPRHTSS